MIKFTWEKEHKHVKFLIIEFVSAGYIGCVSLLGVDCFKWVGRNKWLLGFCWGI